MRGLPIKGLVAGTVAVVAVLVISLVSSDEDEPGRMLAPTEAACQMLADGDTAGQAFDILVGQGVNELAASRAVNTAMNQGC